MYTRDILKMNTKIGIDSHRKFEINMDELDKK